MLTFKRGVLCLLAAPTAAPHSFFAQGVMVTSASGSSDYKPDAPSPTTDDGEDGTLILGHFRKPPPRYQEFLDYFQVKDPADLADLQEDFEVSMEFAENGETADQMWREKYLRGKLDKEMTADHFARLAEEERARAEEERVRAEAERARRDAANREFAGRTGGKEKRSTKKSSEDFLDNIIPVTQTQGAAFDIFPTTQNAQV
ncbi:unnamed protein product [Amoebophrya sp. A120]|nr:unnamed protein product [Amoebophrya sp. A120]|eukprot:GSA120T00012856001.1